MLIFVMTLLPCMVMVQVTESWNSIEFFPSKIISNFSPFKNSWAFYSSSYPPSLNDLKYSPGSFEQLATKFGNRANTWKSGHVA